MTDLVDASWLQKAETQAIFSALDSHLHRTRAVGGIVRDTIMGREHGGDIDMATELLPGEVIARAKDANIAFYPTGIDHGTVTLKLGETLVEVTTLREDVETDGRHAVVRFGTDWMEDARRRDFTLNALYVGADGTLFDPLGGVNDARSGRVRFIGDPDQRIAEDGLRVFRFFRLSASHSNGQLDQDGLFACAAAAGRLDHLSRERVGGEMMRMLALPKVAKVMATMADVGLLPLPDKSKPALAFYEEMGGQAATTRLALISEGDLGFWQDRWRLSKDTTNGALAVWQAAILLAEDRVAEAAYRHGEMAVEGLACVAALEQWGRARLAETARVLASLVVPPFPINGNDLAGLGMAPSPALGRALKQLEQAWIDSGFALSKAQLLGLVEFQP